MASNPTDGIRAIEPRPSLLTSARKTPFGYDVWKSGITFRDTALLIGGRWADRPGSSHADKASAVQAGVAEFIPFTVYLPVACDEATFAREEELTAEAVANAEAETAWSIARELWTGETLNDVVADNPSLQLPFPGSIFTASHILSLGTPLDPVVALGALIQSYQDGTRKGGQMAHFPSIVLPYLVSEKVVTQQGDVYYGPSGTVMVGGPGYPTSGATGPKTTAAPNGTTAATNTAWMYMTGPVEWDATPMRVLPEDQAARFFDRRTNLWQIWAERQAIIRFDPSAVYAVPITVPQSGI